MDAVLKESTVPSPMTGRTNQTWYDKFGAAHVRISFSLSTYTRYASTTYMENVYMALDVAMTTSGQRTSLRGETIIGVWFVVVTIQ